MNPGIEAVIWHVVYLALLIYIARKAQQMNRRNKTPWWWEIGDAINRKWPGTF